MEHVNEMYQLLLEINKLKLVLRNTTTSNDRKESTAEHSWSVSMIIIILMDDLKIEFPNINELKTIKLALIHDIVEIYAGDVMAYDIAARKEKEKVEAEALKNLMAIYPKFGTELHQLWHEFENKESIEAKVAKAADAICPIFLRVQSKQSYQPFNITIEKVENLKAPIFEFSKIFTALYQQLKLDLLKNNLALP